MCWLVVLCRCSPVSGTLATRTRGPRAGWRPAQRASGAGGWSPSRRRALPRTADRPDRVGGRGVDAVVKAVTAAAQERGKAVGERLEGDRIQAALIEPHGHACRELKLGDVVVVKHALEAGVGCGAVLAQDVGRGESSPRVQAREGAEAPLLDVRVEPPGAGLRPPAGTSRRALDPRRRRHRSPARQVREAAEWHRHLAHLLKERLHRDDGCQRADASTGAPGPWSPRTRP